MLPFLRFVSAFKLMLRDVPDDFNPDIEEDPLLNLWNNIKAKAETSEEFTAEYILGLRYKHMSGKDTADLTDDVLLRCNSPAQGGWKCGYHQYASFWKVMVKGVDNLLIISVMEVKLPPECVVSDSGLKWLESVKYNADSRPYNAQLRLISAANDIYPVK